MNKTTYIILGIIAVIAIIAAIYFYNKSKTVVVVQPTPTTNPNQQTGVWSLITGLSGVLSNVDWQGIFNGSNNGGNSRYTDALSQSNCGGLAHWNAQTQQCEA